MEKFGSLSSQRLKVLKLPIHKLKFDKREKLFLLGVVVTVVLVSVLAVVIVVVESGANATVGNQLTSVPYAPFPTIPPT